MIDEKLLQKHIEGGLTDEEIIRAQIAAKRAEIEAEAVERSNIADLEEKRRQMREKQIAAMVEADGQAEAVTRELENLFQQFDRICLEIGKQFIATKSKIVQAQISFEREIKALIPKVDKLKSTYAPEIEADLRELLRTVKDKGAKLESVCSESWQPHLVYQPAYFRNNAYDQPLTNFGSLLANIEKILLTLPAEPPMPETEATTRQQSDNSNFELWVFAQAAAAGIQAEDLPPKKAA